MDTNELCEQHGYDVWMLDVRGYGRSTRPAAMNIYPPENTTHIGPIVRTTDAANDVAIVAQYILDLRGVKKHVAIGWSWGTSIMSTYTALHPNQVSKLVIFAPQWFRNYTAPPTTAYRTITKAQAYSRWRGSLDVCFLLIHFYYQIKINLIEKKIRIPRGRTSLVTKLLIFGGMKHWRQIQWEIILILLLFARRMAFN